MDAEFPRKHLIKEDGEKRHRGLGEEKKPNNRIGTLFCLTLSYTFLSNYLPWEIEQVKYKPWTPGWNVQSRREKGNVATIGTAVLHNCGTLKAKSVPQSLEE